jgi:hypothetical protein
MAHRRSGDDGLVITDELLRRAIFDPAVRTRRVSGRQAGLFVDAEDLRKALADLMPSDVPDDDEVEATVHRYGAIALSACSGG